MLVKCQTQQYRVVEEYKADVQNIVHNVVIYHGVHSKMADCARLMFRDCAIDLTEMVTCRDCYRWMCSRDYSSYSFFWLVKAVQLSHV